MNDDKGSRAPVIVTQMCCRRGPRVESAPTHPYRKTTDKKGFDVISVAHRKSTRKDIHALE
jgi:hypothetical protein